ncbi:hypothetical protein [Aquibium carbonis]|nr:hypothetical protein [Aquibium carbonis]
MNAAEFRKWLAARGCTFETHRGGSGHVRVLLGEAIHPADAWQ